MDGFIHALLSQGMYSVITLNNRILLIKSDILST